MTYHLSQLAINCFCMTRSLHRQIIISTNLLEEIVLL